MTSSEEATASEEKKKEEKSSSKKKSSSSSGKHHKKKDDSASAPESPKKEKSSKKKVEVAPDSPSKREKSKKKTKHDKSTDKSPSEEKEKDIGEKEIDKSPSKQEETVVHVEDDENTKKLTTLLTEEVWSANTAQDTATVLQKLHTMLQESSTTTTLSIELGTPLLVARKMKEHGTDSAVQMAALEIWHHWTSVSSASLLSPWYRLFARVGGLTRVLDCLVLEGAADENKQEEEWKGVLEKALSLIELMTSSPEACLLFIHHQGIETFAKLYGQGHQDKNKETLLARVADLLYRVATTTTAKGHEKVITELASLIQHDSAEPGAVSCQTDILEMFGKMLQAENKDFVPTLIQAKAWAKIQNMLTQGSSQRVDGIAPEMASLQDKAMGLYEKMAASNPATAELLVQNAGIETLKCIVQGKNGALIPRALEVLFQLSATTGTAARGKITEEMGEVLRDSRHEMLQTAIISLLSEMANDEETAQGLLRGQGVESLVYTWETYRKDRQAVSDKALDLLVLLAAKGGAASRQAIIDSGFLTTVAAAMKKDLANDTIHTRGRQLAQALAGEHGPAVDETGILAA